MEEVTNTEGVTSSDNSELSLDEQIEQALNEPDETQPTTTEEPTDGKQQEPPVQSKQEDNSVDCPDKFKNEDGSININNLAKSYKELEPLLNEKSAWEKERAELLEYKKQLEAINQQKEDRARTAGFDSALDMQQSYEVAKYEANEYAKYLQYLDDETRQTVQSLLYQYSNNPSEQLMQEIEIEFAPEINKRIAVQADRMRQKFEAEKQTQAQTQQMSNIEDIISKSVDSNNELFNYEPFKNLFVNTLHRFGDRFTYEDAEALMNAVKDLKGAFEEEFKKSSASTEANKKATDALAAITGQSSAPTTGSEADKIDIRTISDSELNKILDKYI
jgi:hypothetical protein